MAQIYGRVATTSGEGLEGVGVSNGEQVIETTADGSFDLSVTAGEHGFVWVVVPAGWEADGTFFQPVAPLVAGEETVHFELARAPARAAPAFRLAQITDLHIVEESQGHASGEVLVESLALLEREASPDFVVASGDLTNRGTCGELGAMLDALRSASCPVFPLFAGHDGNEERHETGTPGTTLTRNWEKVVGPTYYSFDWGNTHFVLYPTEEGYFAPADQQRKRAWLEADLARVAGLGSICVIVHTPPTTSFIEELSQRGVSLILYGHWHSARSFEHAGVTVAALPPLCFGGIDTSPRAYRLVDYTGRGAAAVTLRYLGGADLTSRTPKIAGYEARWDVAVPGGMHRAAAVAAPGNRLLISLKDENGSRGGGIQCLDAADGSEVWRARTGASIKNRVALLGADRMVGLTVTGQLAAVALDDGEQLWVTALPDHPERWLYTSPEAADGIVYGGGKAGYGAYRGETGEPLWYTPLESSDNWSCYAGPHVAGDLLVCLVQRRGLLALARDSGETVWERPLGVEYLYADPVLADGVLYSGGDGGELLAMRAGDGEVLWRGALDAPYPAGLAVDGEGIYVSTPDGQVQRRALDGGALLWSVRTGADLLDLTPYRRGISSVLAAPTVIDGMVVVGANDGCLYLLEAAGGDLRERADFGMPLTAAATPMADGFCVGCLDGRLVRYRRV